MQRPPEEGLLPHAGEDGEPDEVAPARAVDQERRYLLGELAVEGEEPVGEQAEGDGPEGGRDA
ncbi:hypothetical protein [Rubrobacter marinus]|uniref:hypothetical protein n=1 Tax=Rubrobacter marinus TaxID=2653852 RepID=UPI001D196543|nr:hypothetical protein [Rubrobacter marinus]